MLFFRIFAFILLSCSSLYTSAQIKTYPIKQNHQISDKHQRDSPLLLPFFDDFLGNTINNALWISSGANITQNIARNPISKGVITLDSYNDSAKAYNISSPLAIGYSDTLSSKGIDLATFTPADSLYLSFFWQAQGLGEQPDEEDFILVAFKKSDGSWENVWQKNGNTNPDTIFQQALIPITDIAYFHNDFQFRFLRYAKLSGNFDIWHIDYVYLNHQRNYTDKSTPDIAGSQAIGSYFKNFTAIPAKHFFEYPNPNDLLNTKITFRLKNLDNAFRVLAYECNLIDTISHTTVYSNLPLSAVSPNAPLIFPEDDFLLEVNPQMPALPINTPKAVLKAELAINTSDNNVLIPPIDFRNNDTLQLWATLDNFYAYDDGEAEYVAGINQRLGRIAVRFPILQNAQLTDIDICFVPFIEDLSSQTFVLSVWKTINGRTEEAIFQRSIPVTYPDKPNGFVRFAIDSVANVNVQDTIYIGIQQTTDDLLAIGFDVHKDSFSEVFYNTTGLWEQDANIKGSLMIRPVFDTDIVNALPKAHQNKARIYPNPAKNYLVISHNNLKNVALKDLQGRNQKVFWDKNTQKLHFQLPKGLYFLELENVDNQIFIEKIILY
ncbi:MAG: T9SS type A sorting domain-containing protein [Thermonemataceae bacterium]|nr:T9SS type A sorting domain-containing protein [Thermonemataceae bacterium]